MEEDQIDKAVLAYLKKKGYRAAELAFQDEQQKVKSAASTNPSSAVDLPMDPVIANQILFYSRSDNNPGRYKESYSKLRSWVYSSLDQYKDELLRILYPVYVHSFLDLVAKGFSHEARSFFQSFREDHEALHLRDLQKLEGVLAPQHLEETELARSFRENKIGIRMCQYSFELLLQYLHNTDSMLMLGIVNEHINLQVFPGQPSPLLEEEEAVTLTGKSARIPVAKKASTVQKDSPSVWKAKTKVMRAPQVATVRVPSPISTSRPKTTRAPQVGTVRVPSPISTSGPKTTRDTVTVETPPRNRSIRKPLAALVTPTNKLRKPTATTSCTPKSFTNSKVSTPKGANKSSSTASKASTPGSSIARELNQTTEETPVRKGREMLRAGASAVAQEIPKSGCRNNNRAQQQVVSGWGGSAGAARGRKASPTRGRPPVKHLFLSPQVAKKTVSKKDFVRKSIENHGLWVGSAPAQRKQRPPSAEKQRDVVDSEMPPPAQPTNSPEIPKRGSREASGEGIRGYFGAGPMVAPDGVGFVRDRRKCKPRGTLMVGQEGLSMESDSSGVIEASVQMPPPSVASVEWMMNTNEAKEDANLNDFSSGSIHEPAVSMSISDFQVPDNQGSESFGKEERRTSHEDFCDEALEQLRLSSSIDDIYSEFTKRSQAFLQHLDQQTSESFGKERTNQEDFHDGSLEQLRVSSSNDDDVYSKFTKRSQAFLQHLEMRQSQLTRAVSFSYVRQSRHYNGGESFRRAEQPGVGDSDSQYEEDTTIDWRQGLPSDSSLEMTGAACGQEVDPAGKNELARSSLSFTFSWVPQSEDSKQLTGFENAKTWNAPDSPWHGFSPNTPEFHRNSQLSEGGSKAIDTLVAGSVRRRIMIDQSSSLSDGKLDSLCTSLTQSMQTVNPQDSSSGLSAANSSQETSSFQFSRNSYASASAIDMEPMPLDNFMCQTSSPIERSPYSEDLVCQTASPIDQIYSIACSIDCSVDCSIDCSVNASDDDEVEYASPMLSDYLSPVKHSSFSAAARSDKISPDRSTLCDEINMGARAVRISSMSRTLEELMRHNLTL